MFNGIITHTGKILKIPKKKNNCILVISSKMNFKKNEIGSSISCSGTCLTLENYTNNETKFYLSKETIKRTNFKYLKKGDIVNLEKSLRFGNRMSGHFVQGHVDFTLPRIYKQYLVEKGSIAINGVSLTVVKVFDDSFQISIVPHTLKLTNLVKLKVKDVVNIEFDVLSKYIKNFI
jgi:riboflavin synthase